MLESREHPNPREPDPRRPFREQPFSERPFREQRFNPEPRRGIPELRRNSEPQGLAVQDARQQDDELAYLGPG